MTGRFRAIVYIDGFNLYYGIRRMYANPLTTYDPKRYGETLWLDLVKLAESFLLDNQDLVRVNYFTARIGRPEDKRARQNAYLDALGTLEKLRIIEGEYQYNEKECWHCHHMIPTPKEKQSDVNLASMLLIDVLEDQVDTAYVVSADGDLKAPLEYIKAKYPNKRVIAEFVQANFSHVVSGLCYKTYLINRDRLMTCQLMEDVVLQGGHVVSRPAEWS